VPSLPTLLLFVAIAAGTALLAETTAQLAALSGAFWIALFEFEHRGGRRIHALRFVAGMGVAALACHLGWILLHLESSAPVLRSLFRPAGFCVLFAPIGVVLAGPRPAEERARYLAPALGSLPLAMATARLGCLAVGCCHGVALGGGLVPIQAIEIAGCVLLSLGTRRLPPAMVPAATLAGLGTLRLVVEPWRAPDPLGPPILPTAILAALLLVAGVLPWLGDLTKRASS